MSDQFEHIKIRLLSLLLVEFLILIVIHLFFNESLVVVQYFIILINTVGVLVMYWIMTASRKDRMMSVTKILGTKSKNALDFGQVGMITLNERNDITWMSEIFLQYPQLEIGSRIGTLFPPLSPLIDKSKEEVVVSLGDDVYRVNMMGSDDILYFRNISDVSYLQEENYNNQLVLGIAHLDNYDETTQYEEEQTIALIDANIRQSVVNWADKHKMFVRRIRPDRYLLVLTEKAFQQITKERFSILHDIRKEATKLDTNITLTLAFARKSDNFQDLEDMSNKALEMGQARGGDQVAINTKEAPMKYYGGNTEAVEKRSKVRVRVMAQNLADQISNASNVLIVGHGNSDFDSFGASMGASSIASVYKKDVHIVVDFEDLEANLQNAILQHENEMKKDHNFISLSHALSIMDKSTLLIMVDHHSISQTQFPKLVEQCENIVVIDHHRRSGDFNFEPKLTYIESSASSASELIIELFPYHRRNVVISRIQATLMYVGMLIDTNHFRKRSGSRTFEAAAELRKFGADIDLADDMLKADYGVFELKNKVLAQCKVYDHDYVFATYKDSNLPRALMSQVADEIVSVRDVEASFVIANVENDVVAVSARSNGKLNVQTVMERMGGGGHFTGAAVQLRGHSINEVVSLLEDAITHVKKEMD